VHNRQAPLVVVGAGGGGRVAGRYAPAHAGTYDDEMALLVVHGILHILGMDHVDNEEAEAMEQRERELLEQFHTS